MSRTLIYRTNKEFDKCAELLRNILSVQGKIIEMLLQALFRFIFIDHKIKESRQDSKSPPVRKTNRKKQAQSSPKKPNSKIPLTKSSFIKTNINNVIEPSKVRSSYSPTKNLHSNTEEPSLLKNRQSPNKTRKYVARSPSPRKNSPLRNNNSRQKSPIRRRIQHKKLVRSSSCGDLPPSKSKYMHQKPACLIEDQFLNYLTRIRTISKQIRTRYSNDLECYHLWNELDKSLSSALSYANHHKQVQLSITPLHNEIIELRKQLQTTNTHLHEYDLLHRNNEQYVHLQKKFDTNQIQCTQLSLHNQELKTKCYLLQNKLDQLERNNTRLIQRLTEQDLCSLSKRKEWISTENRFLLCEEIIFLRKKLYHVYDDLSSLLSQNQTLENSLRQQKQQVSLYQQKFNDLKQSAHQLLSDLDNRFIEVKVKRFLNNILLDQHHHELSKNSFHQTPTNANSCFFETLHKPEVIPSSNQPVPTRTYVSPTNSINNKLRPKSLFITPNILNDSKVLSKLQNNTNRTFDITYCSSSTIDDADSTITSSSSEQRKYPTLNHNLPISKVINKTKEYQQIYRNESGPELDQISDLTSKLFGSGDEEDLPNGDMNTSTSSSSTIPSDAEKLIHM